LSLLRGLLRRIEAPARTKTEMSMPPGRVTVLRLRLGPLAHIDSGHLREHFAEAARGTLAEAARLDIETTEELHELTLESIDIACDQV